MIVIMLPITVEGFTVKGSELIALDIEIEDE